MKKGQVFAMDLLIATVLFIVVFATIYASFVYMVTESETETLVRENQKIATALTAGNNPLAIADGQQLNVTRLEMMAGKQYNDIKSELGIKNDFCIYLEDKSGYLISISETKKSIGSLSAKLVINGGEEEIQCGR